MHHYLADVFEAYFGYLYRQSVVLAQFLYPVGNGKCDDHLAAEALVLVQVVDEQQYDVVCVYKVAILVIQAYAVRIAVCSQSYLYFRRGSYEARQLLQVFVQWLGCLTVKAGIFLAVHQYSARQQPAYHILTRAIHGIIGQLVWRLSQRIKVEFALDVLAVHFFQVYIFQQALFLPVLQSFFWYVHLIRYQCLYPGYIAGACRATMRALQLKAVIARRIMRGRDHHALVRLEQVYAQRYHRRAYKTLCQQYLDAITA